MAAVIERLLLAEPVRATTPSPAAATAPKAKMEKPPVKPAPAKGTLTPTLQVGPARPAPGSMLKKR